MTEGSSASSHSSQHAGSGEDDEAAAAAAAVMTPAVPKGLGAEGGHVQVGEEDMVSPLSPINSAQRRFFHVGDRARKTASMIFGRVSAA